MAKSTKKDQPKYWMCIIGPVNESDIPFGGDFAPRMAVRNAICESTGHDPICASGWMDEAETKAVETAKYAHVAKRFS